MKNILLFIALTLSVHTPLKGFELQHIVEPSASMISLQTQNLCHSLYEQKGHLVCLPWSNPIVDTGKISLLAIAKTNEKGLGIYQRARDKDLNQSFLEEVFRNENFQDISGFAEARALYKNTVFSIIPLHFAAGFKLNNPSLPEVHFIEQRQTQIKLSTTWFLDNPLTEEWMSYFIAPSIYHFDRASSSGDYDVLDSATTPYKDLVQNRSLKGANADLALGWSSKILWLPSVTVHGYRLFKESSDCSTCLPTYISLDSLNAPKADASVSWTIDHSFGSSVFGAVIQGKRLFKSIDQDQSAFAYIYKISRLQSYASLSQNQRSFGFLFDANLYQLGIQYSNEIQATALQPKRINQSYAYTALVL